MSKIIIAFQTNEGIYNSLLNMAARQNKTMDELLEEMCVEFIHKDTIGMMDSIIGKLKDRKEKKEEE